MDERIDDIVTGSIWRHFKGRLIRVICVANHTESNELLVIYKHYREDEIWARPIEMFLSPVDKTEYPDCKQYYRFELVKKGKQDE